MLLRLKSTYLLRIISLYLLVVSPSLFAVSIDDMKPGEWYEVPGSEMAQVVSGLSYVEPLRGVSGPQDVIRAWCGGAYDSKRERLIVWGGGHAGYAGNELYAFDTNTLTWERLTDPSSLDGWTKGDDLMPDGRPVSVHTYDQLNYLPPPIDRFWAQGGARWIDGNATLQTWTFDFDNLVWERKSDVPEMLSTGYSNTSDYDFVSGNVFMHGTRYLMEYDAQKDKWIYRSNSEGNLKSGMTGAIDPVRRKFAMIGKGYAYVYDISKKGMLVKQNLTTSGANEIENCNAPGFVYDPVSDKYVSWCTGGNVYSLDMDTLVWEKHVPTSSVVPGNPVVANTKYNGTFGRWRYVPSRNLFVLVYGINESVYFYRLTPGSGKSVPVKLGKPAVSIQ